MEKPNYEKTKDNAFKEYQQIEEVYCPNLKKKVVFNSNGFLHIIYKSKGKKREEPAQLMRLKLLSKAVEIIKATTTIQEYDSFTKEMLVKDHKLRVFKLTKVEYFGYIAIISGWKIKVIIKKIGNGSPFFWSVIPNWVTNKKRDQKFTYKNFSGNLEED